MNLKKILIVLVISVGILILSGLIFLNKFLSAIKAECTEIENIEVEKYNIIRKECQGFVGPFYYPIQLYQHNKKLNGSLVESDSCIFIFAIEKDKMLILDSCLNNASMQYPNKEIMNKNEIDSIIVTDFGSLRTKSLNNFEISEFIKRWNESEPDGAEKMGGKFYPNPKYEVNVYSKEKVRNFKTSHISITEDNSNWSYVIIEDNEDRTTQKFDEIFNMR